MIELAKQSNKYIRKEISKKKLLIISKKGDEYKLDLLNDLEDGTITFYQQEISLISVVVRTFRIPV